MRRPVWMYAVPALVAGLLSGQTLAAQAHMGGGKDAAPTMANCSMMSSMMTAMEGPGAALSKRKGLGLSAAQVTQLEALRAAEMQAMKQAMDSMMTLHKQLAALADAPQFDESAVRGVFDRMGMLHTTAGTAMLRAHHDADAVLTPEQRKKLADSGGMMNMMGNMNMNGMNMSGAAGKGMMDAGMGNMMSMMSMMMSMSGCPMMPGATHTAPAQHQ